MKVYNEQKTQELKDYDLEKGYIKDDSIFLKHHDAQEEVKKVSHFVVVKEYLNGGKDVEEIIDTPFQPKKEAYDEFEKIQVFVPFSEKQLNKAKIAELKQRLAETDFKAIKFAEGVITAEDYAETKAQRQAWRDEINSLET